MDATTKEVYTKEFRRIGVDDTNIKNYLKNEEQCKTLMDVIKESGRTSGDCPKQVGNLIVSLASKAKKSPFRSFIAKYIGEEKITTPAQLQAALDYVKKLKKDDKIDEKDFESKCGVGVVVTREQVQKVIGDYIKEHEEMLKKERYTVNLNQMMGRALKKEELKWANPKEVKEEFDKQILELLGPKTKEDEEMIKQAKKKPKKTEAKKEAKKEEKKTEEKAKPVRRFEARELESAKNPPELLELHRKITGGKVRTRFPPEPNGFLHIGHAKAMNLSFSYAEETGGICFLRFDDTNPEKEEDIYFKSIIEMVEWLGFKPYKITYTSDYFDDMYNFAVQLIKEGKAYVDPSTKEEIKKQKEERRDSPYRNRPIEESLKLFEDMRRGKFAEGEMTLRCKIDMQHDNPNMRDFVAYRIKYVPHPHVGDKWCVYPTYDFSHCIVDSLEHITHSLCTLEFEVRRDSYYWLLEALNLYRPHVWEFSRLNVTTSLLSKRRILKLVKEKKVRGWDDPRLLTLAGLRRRGFTPEGIKAFCNDVGVTRTENLIPFERLEQCIRVDLDERCDRKFAVLDPLKIIITNMGEDEIKYYEAPNHPKKAERGKRKLPFTKIVYIERSDFREKDEKGYYRLAPNKVVGLRYGPNITATNFVKGKDGKIEYVEATVDFEKKVKPKAHIHWLSQPKYGVDPIKAEVRLYEPLFTCKEPSKLKDDWENYLNPNSEKIHLNAMVDPSFEDKSLWKVFNKYQFERLGYFSVDTDTTDDHLVLNRTVDLKEAKDKV